MWTSFFLFLLIQSSFAYADIASCTNQCRERCSRLHYPLLCIRNCVSDECFGTLLNMKLPNLILNIYPKNIKNRLKNFRPSRKFLETASLS